jgi:glucose/arabinose dehydrogenase
MGGGRLARCGVFLATLPALAALLLAGCGSSSRSHGSTSSSRSSGSSSVLVSIGAGLKGRAGLKASVFAQGPESTAAFALDREGRLWLTAAGLEAHTHDGIYLVPRRGARAVKVISGLDDPLGILWHGGRLYVASVGRVDEYGGFDGRRFTQHREILAGPVKGAENNLLVLAGDGRLVMGISATCDHCRPASPLSGSIVSFKPDGSGLRIYASGIRAPVGLAYLPGTNELFTSINQRDDLGEGTPGDWLALVKEGEDWRFPGCYGQGGSACLGVPQPTAVLDKHGAVGGIAMVGEQLGLDGKGGESALVAEWAVSKVQQVTLERVGSRYEGSVASFLTGVRNPLAIILDRQGYLLVGDWTTGTIYRITGSLASAKANV